MNKRQSYYRNRKRTAHNWQFEDLDQPLYSGLKIAVKTS
jgi:hypothetical protein